MRVDATRDVCVAQSTRCRTAASATARPAANRAAPASTTSGKTRSCRTVRPAAEGADCAATSSARRSPRSARGRSAPAASSASPRRFSVGCDSLPARTALRLAPALLGPKIGKHVAEARDDHALTASVVGSVSAFARPHGRGRGRRAPWCARERQVAYVDREVLVAEPEQERSARGSAAMPPHMVSSSRCRLARRPSSRAGAARRVQRAREVGDARVGVDRPPGVLHQVVGPHREEVTLDRQRVGDEHRRRHLDHAADPHDAHVDALVAQRFADSSSRWRRPAALRHCSRAET